MPGAQLQGTRAVTIDAPPGEVWPWIAQIGHHSLGRAGWYAFDLADNDGVPSAWEIIPEAQRPQVGQVIGEEGFTVRAVEVDQLLLLSYHYPKPDWVLKQGLWPRFGSCSWVFVLRPLQEGRTRLIARTRYRVDRLDLSAPFWPLFLVADLASQPTMLRGIKRRAELTSGRAIRTASTSGAVENSITVNARPDVVFDYITDVRNEPQWNQKLTPGEIGPGTRFRVRFGRGVGETIIEDITVDRPRSWTAVSHSRLLGVEAEGRVVQVPGGCRLVMRTRLHAKGPLRIATPLLEWWMHRTWDRDLRTVKAVVERSAQPTGEAREQTP